MTVTAPPRPPRPSDPVDREEVEALVEALIEEARQRARRRRRIRMAVVACVVLVGVTVFAVFERTAESQSSSPALTAGSSLSGGKVKIVIAGTNDDSPVTDGSLAGKGTFKASGAITDAGTALGYRTVRADGDVITLRFVAKAGRARSHTWSRSTRTPAHPGGRLRPARRRTRVFTAKAPRAGTRVHRQHPEGNRVALTSPSQPVVLDRVGPLRRDRDASLAERRCPLFRR